MGIEINDLYFRCQLIRFTILVDVMPISRAREQLFKIIDRYLMALKICISVGAKYLGPLVCFVMLYCVFVTFPCGVKCGT